MQTATNLSLLVSGRLSDRPPFSNMEIKHAKKGTIESLVELAVCVGAGVIFTMLWALFHSDITRLWGLFR